MRADRAGEHPVLRPHRIGIGLYDGDGRPTVCAGGSRSTSTRRRRHRRCRRCAARPAARPAAAQRRRPDVRQGAARRRVGGRRAAVLPGAGRPAGPGRASGRDAWTRVRDAERPVDDLVELMVAALPAETEVDRRRGRADAEPRADRPLPRRRRARPAALARVGRGVRAAAGRAPRRAASRQLAARAGWSRRDRRRERLRGWLDGAGVPTGSTVDAELRWRIAATGWRCSARSTAPRSTRSWPPTAARRARSGRPGAGPPARPGGQARPRGRSSSRTRRCPTGCVEANARGLLAAGAGRADGAVRGALLRRDAGGGAPAYPVASPSRVAEPGLPALRGGAADPGAGRGAARPRRPAARYCAGSSSTRRRPASALWLPAHAR